MNVGVFWIVYEQVYGYKTSFDGKDAKDFETCITCGKTHEDCWEEIRSKYNLPKKSAKPHPFGEVIYDKTLYKFVVIADSKVINNPSLQKKVIKYFKLPRFVIFKEYE